MAYRKQRSVSHGWPPRGIRVQRSQLAAQRFHE